jgi:hypothetical protein
LNDPIPAGGLPAELRLQMLTTEHWSLLSTRALSWSEAFARAGMFLSTLSGAVVALALVGGMTSFDASFVTFALLVLPVVLFIGIATFRRLIEINREDVLWVMGMNRLRRAYLDAAPELRQYFVTGWTDDETGIMRTFGAAPGPGSFAHELVTTPGLIAVIDGVLAGNVAGIAALQIGLAVEVSAVIAIAAALILVGMLATAQYRLVVRSRGAQPRFPTAQAGSSATNR